MTTSASKTIRINAADQTLGRVASRAAQTLLGKHLANFARDRVAATTVIIENTDELKVTGTKEREKIYFRHSGRIGHLKQRTLSELRAHDSREIIRRAIRGMLPKNRLLKTRMKNLILRKGK